VLSPSPIVLHINAFARHDYTHLTRIAPLTESKVAEHNRRTLEKGILERPAEAVTEGVDLLKFKAAMRTKCIELKSELTGRRGMKLCLQHLVDRLHGTDINLRDLPHSSVSLTVSIDALAQKVVEMEAKIDAINHKDELPDLQRVLAGYSGDLETQRAQVADQLSSLRFKVEQVAAANRKEYQDRYWVTTKACSWLTQGGHDKKFAKILACSICAKIQEAAHQPCSFVSAHDKLRIDPPADKFDHDKVTIWTLSVDFPDGSLAKQFQHILDIHAGALDSKMAALSSAVENNNRWSGSMGNLSNVALNAEFGGSLDLELKTHAGSTTWMFCHTPHSKRFACGGYPAPGYAQLFANKTHTMYVQLVPMTPVLDKGIAMTNLESHYETNDGKTFLENEGLLLRVPVGAIFYVPYGYIAHFVYFREGDLQLKNVAKKKDLSLYIYIYIYA
jgi:hypothetical protein